LLGLFSFHSLEDDAMIYRSNLIAPDLAPYFKLCPQAIQVMGHDMPSDPDFDPSCGFLTHDEAAILYNIAKAWPGRWVDIGARLGWTAAHIAAAGSTVTLVEPEARFDAFSNRLESNIDHWWSSITCIDACKSEIHFEDFGGNYDAAMIDGDHDAPQPTLDAQRAIAAGAKVLVFHDFWGQPIQDAVECSPFGWQTRVYNTPNGMAVCWLTDCGFVPPDHTPDPAIDWAQVRRDRVPNFDFSRCS